MPDAARLFKKANLDIAVEAGAGFRAGHDDAAYEREKVVVDPDGTALLG